MRQRRKRKAPQRVTLRDIQSRARKLRNWGRWGKDDEVGTLNHTMPQDIVLAAGLVRKGKVISLALHFDDQGPNPLAIK